MKRPLCLMATLLFWATNAMCGEESLATASKGDDWVRIVVDWSSDTKKQYKFNRRIAEGNSVSLKIVNYNFIRFEPVIAESSRALPQYGALEKLWSQVLAIDPKGVGGDDIPVPAFLEKLGEWRSGIETAEADLAAKLSEAPKTIALTPDDKAKIATHLKEVKTEIDGLQTLRKDAYGEVLGLKPQKSFSPVAEAYHAQMLYSSELERHEEVIDRLEAFVARAQEAGEGRTVPLVARAGGSIVTVSITTQVVPDAGGSSDQIGVAGEKTIEYMVHSKLPVEFHTGAVYSHIQDLRFEKVERSAGDAFLEVGGAEDSPDIAAFLSYQLASTADGESGILLSIGTGVSDPGDRMYLGVSAKLRRELFITAGASTEDDEEGVDLIEQKIFETIKSTRRWGHFVSISYSPF